MLALGGFRALVPKWDSSVSRARQSDFSGVLLLEGSRAPWPHRLPSPMCCAGPGHRYGDAVVAQTRTGRA
eukprot:3842540-Pyramimonas_sp.AAC.1